MPTILIVDDSPFDRRLAGGLLEKQLNCTVRYAADGAEAIRRLDQGMPDLVLTDLQMPQMNGLELVQAVKTGYPLVPIILMTAHGSEEIAAQALRAGAASYVPKRRLAEDLLPLVQRVLLASLEDRDHRQLMHHLEASEMTFVLGNDLTLIESLVDHLQHVLRCLPLDDEIERLRVVLALEEALLNAYYHGNLEVGAALGQADRQAYEELAQQRQGEPPFRDRRIRVTARISRSEAVFVVRDDGPGFDVSQFLASGLLDADRATGRGVVLMRTFMDEVTYNDQGNEVTLVKRRMPELLASDARDDESGAGNAAEPA